MEKNSYSATLSGRDDKKPDSFNDYLEKAKNGKEYGNVDLFKGDYDKKKVIFERVKYVQK